VTGFGDLYPTASLRGNQGVNNYMTYLTGDIPVGAYDADRLANLGIGHGAIDAGGGYTYFDPQTGHEFSAVAGVTYNLINSATHYQNGIDAHLGGLRNSLTNMFTSELSAISTTNLPAIATAAATVERSWPH
jgi:hypothetical protein